MSKIIYGAIITAVFSYFVSYIISPYKCFLTFVFLIFIMGALFYCVAYVYLLRVHVYRN